MGIFEIISAIILIIACVFIVVVVLMKDTKTQMSQTISGSTADSYYGKNSGRTKDAMLNKATVVAAIVFFVLALAVNIINVYFGVSKDEDTSSSVSDSAVGSVAVTAEADSGSITVEADGADNSAPTVSAAESQTPAEGAAESQAPAEGAAESQTPTEGAAESQAPADDAANSVDPATAEAPAAE